MTFGLRQQRFTHEELVEVYGTLYKRFNLPAGQAEQVAREIETHTGIIVEVGAKGFEFFHLSLQEYLAADYVARLADESLLPRLYKNSPATVAVATALSSDPSRFLASLTYRIRTPSDMRPFLTRLLQERPRCIGVSPEHLGVAGVNILFNCAPRSDIVLFEFLGYPGVADAIADVVHRAYDITELGHDMQLTPKPEHDVRLSGFLLLHEGNIDKTVFEELARWSRLAC